MAGLSIAKNLVESEKFFLVRIEPAREVSSTLSLESGTTYSTDFSYNISRVLVDGSEYTEVSGSPSNSEYQVSNNVLYVNLGAALSSQKVVVYYYLFYTRERARQTYLDPEDSNTTNVLWEPRLANSPQVKYDQRDILSGRLSYGSSGITLDNQDSDFQQYLSDNDSFSNKRITVWQCIDSVSNIQKVYRGSIRRVICSDQVNFEVFDDLYKLDKILYSNGNQLSSTFNLTRFANLNPVDDGLPIYKIFSKTSYYKITEEGTAAGLYKLSFDRLLRAVCISYNENPSTSVNRTWGCNIAEGDFGEQSDTVSAVDHSDPNFSLITHGSGKEYKIGDTLEINGSLYVRVLAIVSSTQIRTTKDVSIASTHSITRKGVSAVLIRQNNIDYYALYGRDYTVNTASTTNSVYEIIFANNFEATLGMPSPLSPDSDEVRFRAWGDGTRDLEHGSVIKELIEEAGLSVDAASITEANLTSLPVNFYVPFVDEGFSSYRTVVEKIIKSTFGLIGLNNSLDIIYKLINAPSSTEQTSAREILLNSFNFEIDYDQVYSSITAKNNHESIDVFPASSTLEDLTARYLHEVEKNYELIHVLESPDRTQDILDAISKRNAEYTFTTKTHNVEDVLGDDLELSIDKLPGNVNNRDVKITGMSKQDNQITINAIDIIGL